MKSSRNIRNYFRVAAKYCRILLLFRAGIVIVVGISGVATAQSSSATSPSPAKTSAPAEDKAIRPFHFKAPDAALVDLKRRIAATTRLFPHRVLFREHPSLSVDQWNRPSWRAKMNAHPASGKPPPRQARNIQRPTQNSANGPDTQFLNLLIRFA